MIRMRCCLCFLLVFLFAGCEADSRIKRASSLNVVKAETAKAEFDAADTPEKKIGVADQYFKTAPALLQAVDDYVHGREPKGEPAVMETPIK